MAEKESVELSYVRDDAVQELEDHGAAHSSNQLEVFQLPNRHGYSQTDSLRVEIHLT